MIIIQVSPLQEPLKDKDPLVFVNFISQQQRLGPLGYCASLNGEPSALGGSAGPG